MTQQAKIQPAPADVGARCDALGIPFIRYSDAGQRRSVSAARPALTRWLRSPYLLRLVDDAVRGWLAHSIATPTQLFTGCWALPLHDRRRRRDGTWTVVVMLTDEGLVHEEFMATCQSGRLDATLAQDAWRQTARMGERELMMLWQMLCWEINDLGRLRDAESSLSSFSDELTVAYEEISFLHEIGSSLTELQHPHKFVERVCDEIFETLTFRWVTIGFVDDEKAARLMTNRLFVSGRLPCSELAFRKEASRLFGSMSDLGDEECKRNPVHPFGPVRTSIICYPIVLDGRIVGGIFAGDKEGVDQEISTVDIKMIETAASFVTIMVENAGLYDDQQLMFLGTLEALSASIDAKDPYTCGHSERVAYISAEIARAYGMDERHVERIRIAGLIHDIGKIGVPEAVLCKPGRLTDEEYAQIKKHPEIGYQIVKDIPLLDDTLPGILHHHERFDGRGYPAGLTGEHIPFIARIIGLADAFDAMSSTRTYRAAMDRPKVLSEIHNGAGTQFDPELVAVFSTIDLAVFDQMVERHHQQSAKGGIRLRLSGGEAA